MRITMRKYIAPLFVMLLCGGGWFLWAQFLWAQPGPPLGGPGGPPGQGGPRQGGPGGNRGPVDVGAAINRLFAFDSNADGSLSEEELHDARLQSLFERADANSDALVSRAELTQLLNKESAAVSGQARMNGPQGGPGNPPPPGGGSGFGSPPRPGQVLPPFLADQLQLSAEQREKLDALQQHVDRQLQEILTESQRQQLQQRPPGPPNGRGPGRPGEFSEPNGRSQRPE